MERATITSSALGTVTCCRGGSHGFQENIAGISPNSQAQSGGQEKREEII